MPYGPNPIDTSRIELPLGVRALSEALARNAHDIWARARMAEGWAWGPRRDEAAARHPDLVPFEELPEAEKDYDRRLAMETIKAILSFGYTILPPATDAALPARDPAVPAVAEGWEDPRGSDAGMVIERWRARDRSTWALRPDAYRAVASDLRHVGEPLLAYDVAIEGLGVCPGDLRLRQLLGLVLADLGCLEQARVLLEPLAREPHAEAASLEETLGILARVYKELALAARDGPGRASWWHRSHAAYAAAYRRTGGYWTGINAATSALLLGRRRRARALAVAVERDCQARLAASRDVPAEERYWLHATLGEAALIAGRVDDATDRYRRAVAAVPRAYRNIASSRRNATLVARALGLPWSGVDAALALPRVVVFAGHVTDRPGRRTPRSSPAREADIRAAIGAHLDAIGPAICYASASCAADLLFLEAALERHHEALVLLPCALEAFRQQSVEITADGDRAARFEALLGRVHLFPPVTASRLEPESVYSEFANLVLLGLARHRATELGTTLAGFMASDGKPAGGIGGAVALWRRAGVAYDCIDVGALRARLPALDSPRPTRGRRRARRRAGGPTVQALLFADVKDFSKMPEEMVAPFVRHVLGLVERLARRPALRPLGRESRGDGFYLVFRSVAQAGRFALRLRAELHRIPWARFGLPRDLTMRIALHAGPVLRTRDPITGGIAYVGTHVNRVARIEPVTPAGEIYASQEFAALVALDEVRDFACHYVGQLPLAKSFGTFPMYHVRPLR